METRPLEGNRTAGTRTGLRITEADRAAWRQLAQERAQNAFREGRAAGERGDLQASRRWLERARRISSGAVQVDVALAVSRLATGDADGAIVLLRDLLRRFDFREGWSTLAAAHRARGSLEEAAQAMGRALSHHAPDLSTVRLIGQVARESSWPGWCGLTGDGTLLIDGVDIFASGAGPYDIRLDGKRLTAGLPARWRQGRLIEVRRGSGPLLGSAIDIRSVVRCEGFVEYDETGLSGWLWHPGEPERIPTVQIIGADNSRRRLRLQDFAEHIDSETPLARPRRLAVPSRDLPEGPLRVIADDGTPLVGSPLDPRKLRSRRGTMKPIPAATIGRDPAAGPANAAFDVVIPVFRHLRRTVECIESVRETIPQGSRIVVVEDASPDPAVCRALDELAESGVIVLIRNAVNRGFPHSANRGIAACAGRDVILLNSDTVVAPGWAEALRAAVYAAPDHGTATPLSNDASILSYPGHRIANPVPDRAGTRRLMAFAAAATRDVDAIEIPTGNGFCWYLRRDCLDQTGLLREDLFAQGYGEENDFCLRARHLGWRHVAAPAAYVAHVGNVSFGAARHALMRRNLAIIERLHPGYHALIAAHIEADPLAAARRRIDRLRFIAGRTTPRQAVLLLTHDETGGVERVVRARARALSASQIRPIILRPDGDCCLVDVPGSDLSDRREFPNLRYRLDHDLDALVELLSGEGLLHAEWHHLLGHDPKIRTLCDRLKLPYDIYVHDYASFCARIALVGPARFYCGEPDLSGCEACIEKQGSNLAEAISPRSLVARSAAELAGARAVIAPSEDASRRIARHFPSIRARISPWENDVPDLPLPRFADLAEAPIPTLPRDPQRMRVCVIGAIGVEKGYDILRACIEDARNRSLALDFVVVGHTRDDDALLAAGCLDITGSYREEDAVSLIRAQQCDLAFLPSIWPETWCFTLTHAWKAGLAAAVFDIGAQAERVRRTRRGAIVPLGLPIDKLNDALRHLCTVLPVQRTANSAQESRLLRMAQ